MKRFLKRPDEGLFFNLNYTMDNISDRRKKQKSLMDTRTTDLLDLERTFNEGEVASLEDRLSMHNNDET